MTGRGRHARAHQSRWPGATPGFWIFRSCSWLAPAHLLNGSRRPARRPPGSPPRVPSRQYDAVPGRAKSSSPDAAWDAQLDIIGPGQPQTIPVAVAAVVALLALDSEAGATPRLDIRFIMRGATNWIMCLSRSASAPVSVSSLNAIVLLVIVISDPPETRLRLPEGSCRADAPRVALRRATASELRVYRHVGRLQVALGDLPDDQLRWRLLECRAGEVGLGGAGELAAVLDEVAQRRAEGLFEEAGEVGVARERGADQRSVRQVGIAE